MNKSKKNKCAGFTLVEVLIAVLIFSIIITALFSSFRAFIFSSENIKQSVIQSEKIRSVFRRISMDLGEVYMLQPPRYKPPGFNSDPDPYRFAGKEELIGGQVVSSIMFTSSSHAEIGVDKRTGIARIAYYLKENDINSLTLYRADALPPFPEEPTSCLDPVLCRDISKFEVLYTDVNGEQHKYWDSESEEFKFAFPASIHLKITFGSGEKQQVVETSIGLMPERRSVE